MSNTPRISPTRLPVLTTANLGRQAHFSAVSPRVRVNLTLRRLALEAAKPSVNVLGNAAAVGRAA